jgi:hypothetical protein
MDLLLFLSLIMIVIFLFFISKANLNIRRFENNSTTVENIEYFIFLEKVNIIHSYITLIENIYIGRVVLKIKIELK